MTTWVTTSRQASSSIEKRLRRAPNFCQLLWELAHTHTHPYIRTYTDFKTRSYEKYNTVVRQFVPPCSSHRSFVPMQGQWHTPRSKVLAMPHRMLLEMDTTSGLHMLYKFVLQQFGKCLIRNLARGNLPEACLTQKVLHNLP